MDARRRRWLACLLVVAMLWSLGSASCTPLNGGSTNLSASSSDAPPSAIKSFAETLAEISSGAGQISELKEGTNERRICVFEEKHDSVVGQLEIALMLIRMHERLGLRHLAVEGLLKGQEFPPTKWFRDMGGAEDEALRREIALGLFRSGEITAVELIALIFPDVVLHAADDPTAYAVELSERAGMAGMLYLYRIGLKSARPEHYPNLQHLDQQKDFSELIEYVTTLDPWVKEQHEQLMRSGSVTPIEQSLGRLEEIEERAKTVGAELNPAEQNAMAEAQTFFRAAEQRSVMMARTALSLDRSIPLDAINAGAAHTQSITRVLQEAKATYAVISPLTLIQKQTASDLSQEAFDRKRKQLSVTSTGEGLGSLLDGRKKPSTIIGTYWLTSLAQFRFATAIIVMAANDAGFPSARLKRKLEALDHLRIKWGEVKVNGGDVLFAASVRGQHGWTDLWARGGLLPNIPARPRERTLEELLWETLNEVRKESVEKTRPAKGPARERVTYNIMAIYDKAPQALVHARIAG